MLIKILLLEDDPLFGESIQDFLEEEGFEVTLVPNGQEALSATYENQYDIYLFDINVPLIDGLSLLSDLRGSNDQTPTIFLTSHQELTILTEAFKNGADDYLKKPFATDELIARIHAILRRSGGSKEIHSVGDLSIDTQYKVILVAGKEILLSPKEYQLMALFIRNAGEIVTKEMITNELWSASEPSSEGAIRVYINRLKQEIGNERIINARGLGYRLVP